VRRFLISAYGCEPGKGSEQGVGWQWTLQLASLGEVVVITRTNNASAIDSALPASARSTVRFVYYDLPAGLAWFKKREKGLYLYYVLWQWGAYRLARSLVRETRFDYVMHLTFGTLWLPTFMHRLPGTFIFGPVGGGEAVPFPLVSSLPARARLAQYTRYLLMWTLPANLLLVAPIRRARLILARTQDTARLIPRAYARNVKVVLETSVSEDLLLQNSVPRPAPSPALRVIYTGRLVALKNVPAALHAVARAVSQGAPIVFTILGNGPVRKQLESLARSLGIDDRVEFRGELPHADVVKELQRSDIYLFPSLKEGGVWSLMEAMAVGLPVICSDTSGMSVITSSDCAIRVPPRSQEALINGFSEALIDLCSSSARRKQMGRSGRERIEQCFRWEHKAAFMRSALEEIEHSTGP